MMTKTQKAEQIKSISSCFEKSQAAFVVDFKGLNVEQVTDLRKQLKPINSEMKVVRNTLARLAMKDHPDVDGALSDGFIGTNALVFAYEDPSASAKVITKYSKDFEAFVVKKGVLGKDALDENQIKQLASLPSKDELRAMLLGTLAAPMSKFVRVMNEVPGSFVRVLAAKKDQG